MAPGASRQVTYRPGAWVAIACPGLSVLADADPAGEFVQGCWRLALSGGDVDAVLSLASSTGVDDLAVVGLRNGVRTVVVRGCAVAEIGDELTAERVDAAAHGRQLTPSAGVRLIAGGTTATSSAAIPLASGVTLAATVIVGVMPAAPASGVSVATLLPTAPELEAARAVEVEPQGASPAAPGRRFQHLLGGASPVTTMSEVPVPPSAPEFAPERPAPETEPQPERTTEAEPAFVASFDVPPAPAGTAQTGSAVPTGTSGIIESMPWASAGPLTAFRRPAHATPAPEAAPPQPVAPPPMASGPSFTEAPVHRPPEPTSAPAAATTVTAVVCGLGHLSEQWATTCRVCSMPIQPQSPVTVRRPPLGALVLSRGEPFVLDRDVVFGRAPADPDPDADPQDRPHRVRLDSVEAETLSRNHVRVHLDGWTVQVIDLASTNGTLVSLPGQLAVSLRPQEPFPIVPGTTVTLADDVSFRYEVHA